MSLVKQMFGIVWQNFRKWTTDYRIWAIAILLFVMTDENVRNLTALSKIINTGTSIWIFPFLYSQFYMKIIFTLPLVLLYCNAPFIEQNSLFVISRSGKLKYTIGQIIYIILSACIYYLFIFIISVLLSLPNADISNDWGKILYTVANSQIAFSEGYNFLEYSGFVITYFKPFQAVLFTFLMSSLFAIMIGLIIYAFNIITKTKYIGCVVSGILIVFGSFGEIWKERKFLKCSPASWITVDKLDVGGLTGNPTLAYCLTVYLIMITLLIILIIIVGRKQTVET